MPGFPLRRQNVVRRKVDDELLVFDEESQQAHFLNPTAETIWELCDGQHDDAAIAQAIAERYAVSPARALTDVQGVLKDFRGKNLLE